MTRRFRVVFLFLEVSRERTGRFFSARRFDAALPYCAKPLDFRSTSNRTVPKLFPFC